MTSASKINSENEVNNASTSIQQVDVATFRLVNKIPSEKEGKWIFEIQCSNGVLIFPRFDSLGEGYEYFEDLMEEGE